MAHQRWRPPLGSGHRLLTRQTVVTSCAGGTLNRSGQTGRKAGPARHGQIVIDSSARPQASQYPGMTRALRRLAPAATRLRCRASIRHRTPHRLSDLAAAGQGFLLHVLIPIRRRRGVEELTSPDGKDTVWLWELKPGQHTAAERVGAEAGAWPAT
jgi:hypothetical protein